MAASRRSGKAKGRPKAKPRAGSPSVVSETRAERKKRLERNARAAERRETKRREEARLEREREKKRAARNARAREKKAAEKAEAEQAARAKTIEELAKASREAIRRAARNAKARDRRALARQKRAPGGAGAPGGPPEGYEQIQGEEHPKGSPAEFVTAEMVVMIFREDLRHVAKHISGRYRTHVYQDTAEVTGAAWQETSDDLGDVPEILGGLGDAFRPSSSGIYYGETFFQGYATVVVAGGTRGRRKSDSPLNESRVGPNGKHYRTATTHWFRGDAQKCIATIGYMVSNVMRGRAQFQLVKIGVRQYWSPIGRRPER